MADRFLLLCCRSCLRGDDNTEYYEVLGLENQHVDTDTIKKAYKKASLNLHPDKLAQKGIEQTQEHKQQFLKIKEAYDVLSDPKKRRLYDELGASGMLLLESPSHVNPVDLIKNFQKNKKDRFTMALAVALIFASLLILPILFSLKCDNTLGRRAPWVAIWTPMWVVDGAMLILAVLFFLGGGEEVNDDGEVVSEKIPIYIKVGNFLSTSAFILIQIFVLMHLDHFIHWSWFATFAPWFAYEFLNLLSVSSTAFSRILPPNLDATKLNTAAEEGDAGEAELLMKRVVLENEFFEKSATRLSEQKNFVVYLLRAWLVVFLALKLDQDVDWSWGLVLLPMWVYLVVQYVFSYQFLHWGSAVLKSVNIENINDETDIDPVTATRIQHATALRSTGVAMCFGSLVPLYMALLLVSRLATTGHSGHYTTFVIILPIFIFLGCCCCAVFCGLICLASVDTEDLARSMDHAKGAGKPGETSGEGNGYVPPDPSNVVPARDDSDLEGISPTFVPAYGTFDSSTGGASSIVLSPPPIPGDILSSESKSSSAKAAAPSVETELLDFSSSSPTPASSSGLLAPSSIDADID